ncbi:glutamine synthetase family protein [Lapidilactobacillus bayanensis]|uniref:glutamine synthetase family protein n=1 Tax=Lapidilactobacillus bayanensis TaxID=2485998 RepID=UPI000F76B187|nr:glutamine synthetase family protein [Lapidilactobacillus bayanensis]
MTTQKNINELIDDLRQKGVQIVEFLYDDYTGLTRGKTMVIDDLAAHITSGMGITKAMFASTARDGIVEVADMTAVGELRLVPDLDSLQILPYAPQVATMMCDHYNTDGTRASADPRNTLQTIIAKLKELGLTAKMTYEHEFMLFSGTGADKKPVNPQVCFSTDAMDFAYTFLPEMLNQLRAVGITPVEYYPEAGSGQHELPVAPAEALLAADNEIRFKRIIKHVALEHDMSATFAPKPLLNTEGSGAHVHFSLWQDDGSNAFYDAHDDLQLSQTGYYFIGGMLKHIQALTALTCATVNSYQRLQPGAWSSAFATFGQDNREAAIRVPSTFWGEEGKTMNIELKASDATANPYMALTGILAAGLDGIQHKIKPNLPVDVDPASLTDNQRTELGVQRLPASLEEALTALGQDDFYKEIFSSRTIEAYIKVKQADVTYFAGQTPDQIAQTHRDLY